MLKLLKNVHPDHVYIYIYTYIYNRPKYLKNLPLVCFIQKESSGGIMYIYAKVILIIRQTIEKYFILTSKRFADQGFFSGISFTVILRSYLYTSASNCKKSIIFFRYGIKILKILKLDYFIQCNRS